MTILASPFAPLVVGIVSGTLVTMLALRVLNRFYDQEYVSEKVDKGPSPVQKLVYRASSIHPVRLMQQLEHILQAKKHNETTQSFVEEAFNTNVVALPQVEEMPRHHEAYNKPTVDAVLINNSEPREKDPALVSRQDAIRSRRARAARKQIEKTNTPAVDFLGESDHAASVYRPRHASSKDWGKDGVIRVRQDEYWDSDDAVSQSRIQDSMREVQGIVDEARDYVQSIAVRGTAEDSMIRRMVTPAHDAETTHTELGAREKSNSPLTQQTPKEELEARIRSRAVASAISTRVAYIDEGIFPEKRTLDDLSQKDDWEKALSAMEEKLLSRMPSYIDTRVPTGYLRVIEGGASHAEEPVQGRHFARAAQA